MKRGLIITILLLVACATTALATGKIPYDRSRNPVPNLKSIAVNPSVSRCDTASVSKTFKNYTASGYLGMEIDAVDSTGAAVKGKLMLDDKQVGAGTPPFGITNDGGSAFSKVRFDPYSAVPRSVTFCIRRQ